MTQEDGCLVFNTGKETAKGRALARDPRLLRTATAIAARHLGPERAEEFGKRNGVPGELVVRLRPTKTLAHFDMTG
jgi:hypothetical protein